MTAAPQQQSGNRAAVPVLHPPCFAPPFPAGRQTLYVREFARLLSVTEQHVSDLIEEGKLEAVDISGGGNVLEGMINELARALKCPPDAVRKALNTAHAKMVSKRRYWRITRASFEAFLTRNHSRTL